ncbi:hypothetical protein BGX33_010058 [Mortierella sp. NVP41]|nr:hypothetical protein BGX33_010058 [Mortierella sp. NVP41]
MTAPITSAQSPSVDSTDSKIANEVGMAFAHEFYTFLNKDPSRLHCFYNEHSTMSHGYQGEGILDFSGQQEIHSKIVELDFEDCKVLVSNLDCQGSTHGGIVVQVLGEMSNRGGPAQKFVQTFFLAEQPKGYYVHNDIFRFLKDDYDVEEDEDESEKHSEKVEQEEKVAEPQAEVPVHEIELQVVTVPEVVESAPVEEKVAVAHEPAVVVVAPADIVVEEPVAAIPAKSQHHQDDKAEDKKAEAVKKAGKMPEKKPESSEPAPAPINAETASTSAAVEPAQPEPIPAPAAPVRPPKPKTWANLAANNSNSWGTHVAPAKPASVVVPAPDAKPQTPTPVAPQPQAQGYGQGQAHGQGQVHGQGQAHGQGQGQGQGQAHGYGQGQGRRSVENHSIFIKHVNDRVTEEQLREAFSKFGRIKHLDMTQKKNCAFMDFATPESVVAALKQRNVQVGSEVVLAEERRRGNHNLNNNFNNGPGAPNGRPGYYGNNSNNSNSGFNYSIGHQQQFQGGYRGGRGNHSNSVNSNGVRGGGPPDRKPVQNKPAQTVAAK